MDQQLVRAQIPHALREAHLAGLGERRQGKVRDIYRLPARGALLFVTTDRISAFDRVLGTVPFKGELLTQLAVRWFERTKSVVRNHLLDAPDPQALVVEELQPVPVEVVVRGYLTGSLWRDYQAGRHGHYGIKLAPGLARDSAFATPLVTPTTKEALGTHDQPISAAEIVARGLVERRRWQEIEQVAVALFQAGQAWARTRGLELVDTKYEFGLDRGGQLVLMDEVHTPDSSRYWVREAAGVRALDKEFLRQWLVERGWMGDGPPPAIPDDVWVGLAERYAELFARLEGGEAPLHAGPVAPRLEANLRRAGILS